MGRNGRERTVALPQHTSYGLHLPTMTGTIYSEIFASAHFIWAAPGWWVLASLIVNLCLSTLHMGCTASTQTGRAAARRFASAHFIWAAPGGRGVQRIPVHLCLSTLHMGCTWMRPVWNLCNFALPQHTSYGLHRQNCTETWIQHCKMCCERVDSFSTT